MPATLSYTTREMRDSDLDEVVELMRISLGEDPTRPKTSSSFAWKHFDNPFGRSIALVAEEGGSLVGLRTMMRWDLRTTDAETLRCLRAVDTATHPRMQRQGIFRRLTEEALEVASQQRMDLVFNTPNERSGAGYLKMGWSPVGQITPLVRPLMPRVGKAPYGLDTREVEEDPPVDRPARGLRTPRTPEYRRWRFKSHPGVSYTEVVGQAGRAVYRIHDRGGRKEFRVVEVSGSPWKSLRRTARSVGARYSATWFSPGAPERRGALRSLHLPMPGKGLNLVARPLRDLGLDVTSLGSWDLSLSDLELL